jgi:hypothetical protein
MSYEKIGNSSITACFLRFRYKQEEKIEYYRAKFPRAKWAFFENEFYNDDVEKLKSGQKLEHYKTVHTVPKYTIFKNNHKIGIALPRTNPNLEVNFLFIPNTYRSKWQSTNDKKYAVLRNYYIYDIDDNYVINDGARLLFYQ